MVELVSRRESHMKAWVSHTWKTLVMSLMGGKAIDGHTFPVTFPRILNLWPNVEFIQGGQGHSRFPLLGIS